MNNKEFIACLAEKMNYTNKKTQQQCDALMNIFRQVWKEGDNVVLQSFGTFEIKKRNEKIVTNPLTQQKFLSPPKLTLSFRPSNVLKDKIKKV